MVVINLVSTIIKPDGMVNGDFSPMQVLAVALVALVSVLLFIAVVYPIAIGATTFAVGEIYLGREVTVGDCFARAFDRLWQLILVQTSVGLRVLLGMMLFVVPGLIWLLSYSVAVPVALLELQRHKPASTAMERSKELTDGHRWQIFLAVFVMGIVTGIGSAAAGAVAAMIPGDGMLSTALGSVLSSLIEMLLTPLGLVLNVLIYYDLRIRKEGFDLEMLSGSVSGLNADTSPSMLGK